MFFVTANPMVERLRLPESLTRAFEQLVRLASSVALPALHNAAQRLVWHRPQHSMNVIRHYHPRIQPIPLVREKTKRTRDQVGYVRPPEPALATAFVEVF